MENEQLINDIAEINRRLFYDIWNITTASGSPTGLSPRLILPVKRNEEIRLSEQEARFLYTSLLNSLNYFYSVETPTEELYVQTGKTPQSASSDLSIYGYKGNVFCKLMNVEFKAHNPSYENIRKDIEKLMREGVPGNWFHLLKNIDSRTLQSLFGKISISMYECYSSFDCQNKSIVFSFCVRDKKWACMKHFKFDQSKKIVFNDYVNEFFSLEYSIKHDRIEVSNPLGWYIVQSN